MTNTQNYLPIIGLEVHVELKTKSKMFCSCRAEYFGHKPNTHTCPVCLGLPGALPVPNQQAIEWSLLLGLALNCEIPKFSKFDRKNYFYPDLPKGYQISQYDLPLAHHGELKLKIIRIRRVHLEEDTAKLIHTKIGTQKYTLIDFNRSGVPLMEIVTEPDIRSAQEAKIFLQKLQQIIRYLGISDCDMEKGTMRLEPNISIKIKNQNVKSKNTNQKSKIDEELPNYKVEVKNINSFRFVEKAIDYEIKRQIELLKKGETPKQETRGWDEKKGATLPQRGKEEAYDYRYFPEPDIPPLRWSQSQISKLKSQIPELPDAKLARFMKDYSLSEYDANILTTTLPIADFYEKSIKYKVSSIKYQEIEPKTIANWVINKRVDINKTSPGQLLQMIWEKAAPWLISEEKLKKIIKKILLDNPKAVSDYKSGKQEVIMYLVGQIMRGTKGKAEGGKIKKILEGLIE